MADAETVKKIEEGFKTLQGAADCKSLLKKHLTQAVVNKLKGQKTKMGATLLDVIQSGIHGEHSETQGGVFDISNKARFGISEYTAVKTMYYGVKKLIEMEKAA